MLARVLLAALAVVAAATGVQALRHDHGCTELRTQALRGPPARVAARAIATCGEPLDRSAIDVSLYGRGRRAEAAALARAMTRSTPQDWVSWLVRYRVTGDHAALEQVRRLNPRGAPRP